MPRWRKAVKTESSTLGNLLIDARDVFSREKYEERLDYQLAILTQLFHKNKTVDNAQVKKVVEEFIKDVEIILRELEDAKRKAEQEEARKIDKIRQLLAEGAKVNSRKFKGELEKFGEELKSNNVSALRSQTRRERRLRRGRAPIGYFLKKVRKDKALDRDIARRTGNLIEDAQKEHELSISARFIIEALKVNPNEQALARLEGMVKSLVENYENDLDDFLNIEIDIEIEQARKLHRIDHYIEFLRMVKNFDDLIKKLNELKDRVKVWVYQDSIDAKKLVRYAKSLNYGIDVLAKSKASEEADFRNKDRNIVVQNAPIGDMKGLLIYDKSKPKPTRAVVILHGVFQSKETWVTLGKRLASLDFWVYTLDLTSHGESREKIHLGRNCEHVQTAVRYFRANGIRNVGVIGHSLGGISALFAICGYNVQVEKWFFQLETKIQELLDKSLEELQNNRVYTINERNWDMSKELSKYYRGLKRVVLKGMKTMYTGNNSTGKIDAVVLLGTPISIQFVFPPVAARFLKNRSKKFHKRLGKLVNYYFNYKYRKQEGPNALQYKWVSKGNEVQMMSAVFEDIYYTYNYAETVKNPFDYMSFLNYICDSDKSKMIDNKFFIYYRNIIKNVPKLFMYGLKDQWLKPLKKTNMPDLEKHYEDFSSEKLDEFGKRIKKVVVRHPDIIHALNEEGKHWQFEGGTLPDITYQIVTFLNQFLGSGRVLISQEGNVKKKGFEGWTKVAPKNEPAFSR